MKRIFYFITLICLALPSVSKAQNLYYFNEGDTIHGRDTTYYYQWWSEQWLASDPIHQLNLWHFSLSASDVTFHGKIVKYHYTEQPLNIVGIATSFFNMCINGLYTYEHGLPFREPCDVPPERQEYLLLYEADTSRLHFYEVGRIPIDYTKPSRYMNVDYRFSNYCCNIAPDNNKVIKIREYYFDKPITVKDSFYVGHTSYNEPWPDPDRDPYADWTFKTCCWSLYYEINNRDCPSDQLNCDALPLMRYKFKQDDFQMPSGLIDSSIWYYFHIPEFTIEFPIIEIDSSFYDGPPQYVCPQVQNFRIAQAAEGTVVFLWDTHGDHQRWQMSYGPAGTEPEDGTIVNCPMQVGQIMGLDTCTDYVAYIRAVCNHDSIVYSEWSAPLAFNICDTSGGGTAAIEGGLGQYIQLFPSPATDQVQLMSSFELRSIEVYDLQGRTLLNIPCEGHTAAFDVAGWPKGMYVAIVRTSAGNFTKKLIIKQ